MKRRHVGRLQVTNYRYVQMQYIYGGQDSGLQSVVLVAVRWRRITHSYPRSFYACSVFALQRCYSEVRCIPPARDSHFCMIEKVKDLYGNWTTFCFFESNFESVFPIHSRVKLFSKQFQVFEINLIIFPSKYQRTSKFIYTLDDLNENSVCWFGFFSDNFPFPFLKCKVSNESRWFFWSTFLISLVTIFEYSRAEILGKYTILYVSFLVFICQYSTLFLLIY